MKLTDAEEELFQKATKCHICSHELGADRVRGHNHLTGKFTGPANSDCNLQLQFRKAKNTQCRHTHRDLYYKINHIRFM